MNVGLGEEIRPSDAGFDTPVQLIGRTAATVVPHRSAPRAPARRRKVGGIRGEDAAALIGSLLSALCLSSLLFGRLAPFSGLIAFLAVTYLVFIAIYVVVVAQSHDMPAVKNALATVLLSSAAILVFLALADVVIFTFWRGHSALFHSNFFTQDLSRTGPLSPLTTGGLEHAVVGTLWMISIGLAICVPLGLVCAVYIHQSLSRFSRFVRTVVEAMTALPSVIAGLFIYATWEVTLHKQKSGLAAALALSIMMLPIIIRASDVVLRLVPGNLKEASAALGAPTWRTVWHVTLPTARSGLATAIILGAARGIGETSPVLLTAGYTTYLNTNPSQGPMVSLPLAAFKLVSSPQPAFIARGFAAAAFLLLLVVVLFTISRAIGGRAPGDLNRRQRRRAQRRSRRDQVRFSAREFKRAHQVALSGNTIQGE